MNVKDTIYDYVEELRGFLGGHRTLSELSSTVIKLGYLSDVIDKNTECSDLITPYDVSYNVTNKYVKIKNWEEIKPIIEPHICWQGSIAVFASDGTDILNIDVSDIEKIAGKTFKVYNYNNIAVEVGDSNTSYFIPYCIIEKAMVNET